LAVLILAVSGWLFANSSVEDSRYLASLDREIAKLEPMARRAAALDRDMMRAQSRARLLDDFRGRTKSDLEALNELTRLLAPPAWTSMLDLTPDAATINGETEQAAPLLKLLDASPYFQNSTFIGAL